MALRRQPGQSEFYLSGNPERVIERRGYRYVMSDMASLLYTDIHSFVGGRGGVRL